MELQIKGALSLEGWDAGWGPKQTRQWNAGWDIFFLYVHWQRLGERIHLNTVYMVNTDTLCIKPWTESRINHKGSVANHYSMKNMFKNNNLIQTECSGYNRKFLPIDNLSMNQWRSTSNVIPALNNLAAFSNSWCHHRLLPLPVVAANQAALRGKVKS